jgi:hypothetical protein
MIRLVAATAILSAAIAGAQQPSVINARVETRALSGSLSQEFHKLEASASTAVWMGYTEPMIPRQGDMCGNDEHHTNLIRLEGPETLVVLFRFENHALDRVRISSADCQFDAGGLSFVLLTGVSPAQSVELLSELARTWAQTGRRAHFDSIISAIALERDPAADHALEAMVVSSQPETMREKALFWLANSRGKSGFETVRKVLQSDPSDRIREKATFDVTLSKEPGAIAALIESAHNDHTPKVRSQALFWLAHKAGKENAQVILQAARQDPDANVRKQAVFALEQIPQGDGVPLLIELAKSGADTKVREQAVFWLGHSKDPRATRFFEDILK